jgi:serine/threonine protein kinase/tetratricopeptide (TPR) repeat protein
VVRPVIETVNWPHCTGRALQGARPFVMVESVLNDTGWHEIPTMESSRWERVVELFEAAMELPQGERRPFLDRACEGDDALLDQVESLLGASDRSLGHLHRAVHEEASQVHAPAVVPAPGDRIGPYRVGEVIGEGGMGVVLRATRDDDEYHEEVALKLVRGGWLGAETLRRFREERQILANLRHPNIASLLDGGTTEAGAPFLVMEYVQGDPITDYCQNHRLSVEDRLRLFATVCRTVDHAHHNLVVHRDVKPSNILVTPEGQPRLLDFGIAKLLNPVESDGHETGTGTFLLTPSAASPEQVQGGSVTPATDVYALGLLLYQILTGLQPQQGETDTPQELIHLVCDHDPDRPSVAVRKRSTSATDGTVSAFSGHDENLSRRLRGDLDAIVMRAIRKDPLLRYASAGELADDIERHLDHQPVAARRHSRRYVASRFIRRHRLGVTAATVALSTLLVGFVGTGLALVEARRAQAEAESTAARLAALNEFMSDMLTAPTAEGGGPDILVVDVLNQGAAGLEDLQSAPDVRAEIAATLGAVHHRLGLWREGRRLLDEERTRAHASLGAEHPASLRITDELISVLEDQAELGAAEKLARDNARIRSETIGPDNPETLRTKTTLAHLIGLQGGRAEEAVQVLDQVHETLARTVGPGDPTTLNVLRTIGFTWFNAQDFQRAEAVLAEEVADWKRVTADVDIRALQARNMLAVVIREQGRYDEAEAMYRSILATIDQVVTARPDDGAFRVYQPRTLFNLAGVLVNQGRLDEAEIAYRRSNELNHALYPPNHPEILKTNVNLGACLNRAGRPSEAIPLLTIAHAERATTFGADHWSTFSARLHLIEAHLRTGTIDDATALLNDARPVATALQEGTSKWSGPLHQAMRGAWLVRAGSCAEGFAELDTALGELRDRYGADNDYTRRVADLRRTAESW